jgi:hypothetical protein
MLDNNYLPDLKRDIVNSLIKEIGISRDKNFKDNIALNRSNIDCFFHK